MSVVLRHRWFGVLAAVSLLAGCNNVGRQDAEESSLALMSKAEAKQAAGDTDGAIDLYNEALLEHPRAALAHLDLALLMHDSRRDLAAAIYHYKRYIEMRPDTEKKEMILSRMRLAKQAFGARSPEEVEEAAGRIAALESENARLKLEVEKLQGVLTELRAVQQAAEQARQSAPRGAGRTPAEPRPGEPRTYRVQRGDTLASIAAEVYGDPTTWRRIYEANKASISDSDRVPAGAVLVIP